MDLDGLEILEQETIGDKEYIAICLDDCCLPEMLGSYNHNLEEPCPRCSSINTCCISPKYNPSGWYCKDCLTLWEWRLLDG